MGKRINEIPRFQDCIHIMRCYMSVCVDNQSKGRPRFEVSRTLSIGYSTFQWGNWEEG